MGGEVIREYKPEDLERLKQIHARQGFDYPFPDVEDRNFLTRLVIEEDGRVEMAALARLTTELFLLVDPQAGTAAERWERLQRLQGAVEEDLWRKGADDLHAWVPPELVKSFGRRLTRKRNGMGFVRDDRYVPFCRYLDPATMGPRVTGGGNG